MIKIAIISLFAIALVTFAMRLMPKLRHLFQIHKSPDSVMIMKRYVRISIFGLLFPILASINVAWAKNWNQNKEPVSGSDLKCEMLLHKYTSPSINGCVFSINASGSASFRRNGRTGSIEVCDPNAKESDVKEIT